MFKYIALAAVFFLAFLVFSNQSRVMGLLGTMNSVNEIKKEAEKAGGELKDALKKRMELINELQPK